MSKSFGGHQGGGGYKNAGEDALVNDEIGRTAV
jgi:hypothetical protein